MILKLFMTFKQMIQEIKKTDGQFNLNVLDNKKPSELIYKGKVFSLFLSDDKHMLFLLKDNEIIYRMNVSLYKQTFFLGARHKIDTREKNLTFKIIFTLLFLGYEVKDDFQFNEDGFRVLKNIIDNRRITVIVNGKEIDDIEEINDGSNIEPTFIMKDRNDRFILEGKPFTETMWLDGCVFDEADNFVAKYLYDGMSNDVIEY